MMDNKDKTPDPSTTCAFTGEPIVDGDGWSIEDEIEYREETAYRAWLKSMPTNRRELEERMMNRED